MNAIKIIRTIIFATIIFGALFIIVWYSRIYKQPISFNIQTLKSTKNLVPILIIGSGPAGLSAAIFGARAHFETIVIAGPQLGGQIAEASYVENWPGLNHRDTGANTIDLVKKQAEHFGAQIIQDSVDHVDCSQWPFQVYLGDGTSLQALSLIVATGGNQKTLDIPGVKEYWGKGIGVCSICDAPFDAGKDVAIIGGGDSAADKALQSAAYARHVTIVVKNEQMHAAAVIQDYLKTATNIAIQYNVEPTKIIGNESITNLELYNNKTKQKETMAIQRIYFALGFTPNSELFKHCLTVDKNGYIKVLCGTQKSSREGIFVAGNVEDQRYQKASVAAGRGVAAAIDAIEFLQSIGFTPTEQQNYVDSLYKSEQ